MSNKNQKVFVALSGGVDSSVAAALLKKDGFRVVGCHIKCFNLDGCGEKDIEDARRVAEKLAIPFYVFDLEKEYKDKVVRYMVDGYKNGLTPNPDVMCNSQIKFGLFLKRALELGADYIATGHYVRLCQLASAGPVFSLKVAKDKNKDQSYFLWTLTQDQLKRCLFPIGDYTKKEVRQMAKKFGLPTAEKKDSQGICFLGKITLANFLGKYIPQKKGLILNVAGEKMGNHQGAHLYTIGQRHGLKLRGGTKPYYVADKDVKNNIITIAENNDNSNLYKSEVKLKDINLISPKMVTSVCARLRYRQPLFKATLSGSRLVFNEPQKFIAPGQSAVFYNTKGELLGGGVME